MDPALHIFNIIAYSIVAAVFAIALAAAISCISVKSIATWHLILWKTHTKFAMWHAAKWKAGLPPQKKGNQPNGNESLF